MSRGRRRISRGLIALLVITITVGLVFYFHDMNKSAAKNAATASASASNAPKIELAPAPPIAKPQPVVATDAPSTQPTTKPSDFLANSAPATQPASHAAAERTRGASGPSVNSSSSSDPIADGKSKIDSGDLLAARSILNSALISSRFTPPEAAKAKELLNQINQTVVFSSKRFADDEMGGTYSVQTGEILRNIARAHVVTPELLCRINGLSDPRKLRAGATLKVLKGPFNALVDKSDFTIEIWIGEPYSAGSYYIKSYGVGLGRDDSTPTGKWLVEPQKKIKNPTYYSPRGEGVINADDPKNPLGEFWIGLTGVDGHAVGKQSYGIHGTIDPDSIGKQASMGCIRMRNEDVAEVYELLVEGKSSVSVRD